MIMRRELPPDTDANVVAQCEADYFVKCPICSQLFEIRNLAQVVEHIHGSEIDVLEGPGPPRDPPVNCYGHLAQGGSSNAPWPDAPRVRP
jgi:hypothetical protein